MDSFYRLAGKLIEYYRKDMQSKYGNAYNVKQFCSDEKGANICSFPTYKKIALGESVTNEGFYYVLSHKLGVQFETFDEGDEDFLYQFAAHYCEVYESHSEKQKLYFCDYYESFFKNQKEHLVFRELWACLCLLKGTNEDSQNMYLDAIEAVVNSERFVQCIKSMRV